MATNVNRLALFSGAAALLALPTAANAAAFQNGSFENGAFVDNTGQNTDSLAQGSTAMTGWTVIGTGDVAWEHIPNPFTVVPSDGAYSLDLTGYRDASPYGGVQQTFDTIAGHTYSLSFDVGNSGRYNSAPGATVSALINELGIYAFNNSGLDSTDPNRSFWLTGTTSFMALTNSTQLQLLGTLGGAYIGLDHVVVTDLTPNNALPEPASWATMIAGFGLAGAAMRRRRVAVRFA